MAGPGDEIAAGAGECGRLRASHADREQVIDVLKAAFVQGRLTKDEFDVRVGEVLASRTYADLAATTTDIPAGVVAPAQPLRTTAPARGTWRTWCYRHRRALGLVACGVIPLALLVAAFITDNNDFWPAILVAFFAAIFTAGGIVATAEEQKHSSGQLPQVPVPRAGGQVSPRPAPAAGAGQLPQIDQAPRHKAEAASPRVPRAHLRAWRPPRGWQPGGRRYGICLEAEPEPGSAASALG
jgi:Domain of unknown function (DUF1707)